MIRPILKGNPQEHRYIDRFGGYNHGLRIGDGQWYDMANFDSSSLPVLSTRQYRRGYGRIHGQNDITGLGGEHLVCYTAGSRLIYGFDREDGSGYDIADIGLDPATKKQIITMGAYIIVFPDGIALNTTDGSWESLSTSCGIESAAITMCDETGKQRTVQYADGAMPPETGNADGDFWIDHEDPREPALKRYSTITNRWMPVDSYISIGAEGFAEGDMVDFQGFADTGSITDTSTGLPVAGNQAADIAALEGERLIVKASGGNIIVHGVVENSISISVTPGAVRIIQQPPVMDFVVEHGNRLWGCRYGNNNKGDFVNEIYASALGSYKNWRKFSGISTDSYIASVGMSGPWTGAAVTDHPIFAKENALFDVRGTIPANFTVRCTECDSVIPGASGTMAVLNGVLLYASRNKIMAYDGNLPVDISQDLHLDGPFGDAAAATEDKYYIAGHDGIFVFDRINRVWFRESLPTNENLAEERIHGMHYVQGTVFAYHGSDLMELSENVQVPSLRSGRAFPELPKGHEIPFLWYLESGDLGLDTHDGKYISRVTVMIGMQDGRLRLSNGQQLQQEEVYMQAEVSYAPGQWIPVGTVHHKGLRSVAFPVRLRRCDHFKLRLSGTGPVSIYSIEYTIERGGRK